MIKNYIKIALRNLNKNKNYAFINISGLAVGMACCILIALYSQSELSFDTFHKKADRIVVVGSDGDFFGKMLSTPYPLADALVDEIPSVEKSVRVSDMGKLNLSTNGQDFVKINHGTYTEDSFFDIFSFDLIRGDSSQVLSAPNSIVLTPEASHQLFGDENPLGKSLYWQKRDTTKMLQVTGIVQDAPRNSSIEFGALVSLNTMDKNRRQPDSWHSYFIHTYALLKSHNAIALMPDRLKKLVKDHYKSHDKKQKAPSNSFFTTPITQFHLSDISNDSGFTGNRAYLYLFGSVALFILIIACVNYVNLATARISLRSQEVGVRKSLGALRSQVAGQFLGESIFLSVTSFLLGIVISIGALPYFNQLFGTSLQWQGHGMFLVELFLAAIGVGILAGLYPALYLSGFSPVTVLRNRMDVGGSGSWLRKTLVVSQFAIALVLIISALVVYKQLNYTQKADLGFDGKQVAAINLPNNHAWKMRKNIRNQLINYAGVEAVS
ncbi:MAG TPA: ABC transporter permease, partial [Balneolaceae bacterium]|nr:ABC transporter permease [Balneolaceae bacterium]